MNQIFNILLKKNSSFIWIKLMYELDFNKEGDKLSAKEKEERNKRPKSEEGKLIGSLLKASERILRTLVQVE